jgi:very-short-patch-repair endonuclease
MTLLPNDLLRRLFEYIGEQIKDVDPRAYQLSETSGFQCQPSDISGLPGIQLDIQTEGDHIWLRVARLEADAPPKAPEPHRPLFHISSDPFGPLPALDEAAFLRKVTHLTASQNPEEREQIETNLRASEELALESYTSLWKSWAEGEKPIRKTISLYGDLFAVKRQMEAEETAKPMELAWGVGVSTWQMSFEGKPVSFRYPLLTQAAEIAVDEQSMTLEIRPRATNTRLEFNALVACSVPGAADVENASREHLQRNKDRIVTPFDPGSYTDILKMAAANLDSHGSYKNILAQGDPLPPVGEHLIVTDSWVLFARPRTNNYLVDDLRRLQEKLASGCDIPSGPLALVSQPSDEPIEFETVNFRGISSRGNYSSGKTLQELFFPLPYNSEQVTIVQRLERAAGVTVQGPPGTGKTHTIANIICHYLATGRRVLVTSRGEQALKELQSKIPEEVRPLTVALLTSDREGIRQFQASIEAIQHRVSQLNPEQTRLEIETLRQAIDRAHVELESIDRRIDEIALVQLAEIEVDGARMRAQKLAEIVLSGRDHYAWFDDELSLSAKHAPPLNEDEAGRLRETRRGLGFDLVYTHARIPSADDLPGAAEIAELHGVLCRMKELEEEEQTGKIPALKAITRDVLQSARELLDQVEEASALLEELEAVDGGWPLELRVKCRQSSFASERVALEGLFDELDRLVETRAQFLKRPVEFPEVGVASIKTKEAVARAALTGQPFRLFSLGAGDAKEHLASVKVAGLPPKNNEDWEHVQKYLVLHEQVTTFVARWNQIADTLPVPHLNPSVLELRLIEQTALAARKAHRVAIQFDRELPKKAELVFNESPNNELAGRSADLRLVRGYLLRHLTRADLARAATNLSALQEKLAGRTGPISDALRHFVNGELGNSALDTRQAAGKFAELTVELRRIAALSMELSTLRDLAKRLENAGAPNLAARLCSMSASRTGEDAIFPASWRDAWNWARIRSYLESIEARKELVTISERRRNLEGGLARLYKDMVSKAAWLATKRNSTPRVLQALAGYATAIRRIGLGTGPNAVRYRRDARESMLDAAGAVPCWVMSHAKISESMPAEIGVFDLVIVDEASQSDLWALPAIVRGKKILVVGDDKQVSPDGGFISSQRIVELKHRFLADQPYGVEMTPEKSLYDLAARVFAAEQVMLREHFRCVPPIIAYSNRTFYKGSILPLRIPKASERIDPPLVDVYVEGGIRDGHDCNGLEAEAITAEIISILKDERLAKMTLGVVSLLGMDQAKCIDSLVRQHCSATELLHRKFECGDARTFQGSERDIMFLSLVADSRSCKALSGNMFEQRFNVAASRARNRMYLFRSVTPSHLSDKDLRLTLLRHFERPIVTDASDAERLVDRCESGFEVDVFTNLVKRGFRVIPQVKTGAYRIDMVVEGARDNRLAIECDGDEYHGPDRWQHDMNRQRVLERAGWTFWRCFASTWSLHKDDVLSELLDRLASMGIEPLGALDRAPSLVEKRTWRSASLGKDDPVSDVLESAVGDTD